MSKSSEIVKIALLGVIAASGIVTAAGVVKVARDGFEMEISLEEAREIEEAAQVAYEDMLSEEGEE